MRKNIYKTLGMLAIFSLASCSEELIFNEVIDGVSSGAVLRNLGVTNSLDIEDGASAYSIILEAQDAAGGSLLQEVRVSVGFNDIDDSGTDTTSVSSYTVIPAASFTETSPTTHGLPVATFSITLNELLSHIGSTLPNISVGDNFIIEFDMVLTDGRVFNIGNATQDVTRTGFFSYFNSQFRYTATVGDPQRLVLSSTSVADFNETGGRLRDAGQDTVFLTFDREDAFVTTPTVTRISAIGATDDVVSALTQSDDDADTYFFLYTAGGSVADTVDFVISDGSTVAGLSMTDVTLSDAYIIDNVAPAAGVIGATTVSSDAGGRILNVSVDLTFEALAAESYTVEIVDNNGAFETQTQSISVAKGQELITIQFVPQDAEGVALPEGALDFDVTITDISDLVGNTSTPVTTVQLGN